MSGAELLAAACAPPGGPVDWASAERLLALVVPAPRLASTPQDPIFHAEGDVWRHTRLAVEQLVGSTAYATAPPAERALLFCAVLLHDAGKAWATVEEPGGRISSRGHAARGAALARAALWRAGVPFALREHVCALVRHHQVPFHGLSGSRAEAERLAIRSSLLSRNDLLCAVAEADALGRRCADEREGRRIADEVALWREHCAELGVLAAPFRFPSEHSRVVYFAPGGEARAPGALAHDDCRAEVVVMSGLPGAGKDHWLHRNRPGLPVVSLDALRQELGIDPAGEQGAVVAAARERARAHLRAGEPFAWNATNVSLDVRGRVISLLRDYQARIHIVYCEAAAEEQVHRNRSRPAAVPAAALDRMLVRWAVPTPLEAHQVTYQVAAPGAPGWPPAAG